MVIFFYIKDFARILVLKKYAWGNSQIIFFGITKVSNNNEIDSSQLEKIEVL